MSTALVGSSIVGIVAFLLGALMLWKKRSIKAVTWLWVIAGFTLAGPLVDQIRRLITEAAKTAGGPFGLGVNVILGILGCALFWIVWQEAPLRKGKGAAAGGPGSAGGKRYTPVLGLLAPILVLSAGGVLGGWAAGAAETIGRLGGPIATFFGA